MEYIIFQLMTFYYNFPRLSIKCTKNIKFYISGKSRKNPCFFLLYTPMDNKRTTFFGFFRKLFSDVLHYVVVNRPVACLVYVKSLDCKLRLKPALLVLKVAVDVDIPLSVLPG